jgi:hypothetical protein
MTKNDEGKIEFYAGDYTKNNTFYRRIKKFKNRTHIDTEIFSVCTKLDLPEWSFPVPVDETLVKYHKYFTPSE